MLQLLATLASAQQAPAVLGPSVPPELYPTVAGPAVPVELTVTLEAPIAPSALEAPGVEPAAELLPPEAFVIPSETETELLQRFSEAPIASASEAAAFSLEGGKSWLWAIGFAVVGLAWFGRDKLMRKVASGGGDTSPLKILAREGVGQQAGLVLLEAATGDGGSRRLLISGSSHGPPSLVADLGGEIPGFEELVAQDAREELALVEPAPSFHVEFDEEPDTEDQDSLAAELERTARLTASLIAQQPPPPAFEMPRAESPRAAAGQPRRPRPKKALTGRFTDADFAPIEDDPIDQVRSWTSTRDLPGEASVQDRQSLIDTILESPVAARVRAWG